LEAVGAFLELDGFEDLAEVAPVSSVVRRWVMRNQCLIFARACSIGLRSGG
jgi:hypothetical protein